MSAQPEFADTALDSPSLAPARAAVERYGDALLRRCAAQFGRQRVQNEPKELRDHIVTALENSVLIDRTIKGLTPAARRLLRLVGMSRQHRWLVQALVDIGSILQSEDGIAPIRELLESGLAFPELSARGGKILSWDEWLSGATTQALAIHIPPLAAARAHREPLNLPKVDFDVLPHVPMEADGNEWLLRMAVAWQFVRESPLRLTQQNGFFKRDLDRLRSHPLLAAPPSEHIEEVPDPALLAIALAQSERLLIRDSEQVSVQDFPAAWSGGLGAALESLWSSVVALKDWGPLSGCMGESNRPLAALAVLALAILADLPQDQWAVADDVDHALAAGADGRPGAVAAFLLGLAHQMRFVQAAKHLDRWWVRLSPMGRAILSGLTPRPTAPPAEQTLVVQPNLEIVLYRQGLTPKLIARLSHIAEWKSLGLACTLGLTAESVYRGLESGESLGDILALFNRHGTRPLSDTVLNSLRSWASKRERVLVFPSALVLEFRNRDDLDRAVRHGLIEHRLTDRIGLIGNEGSIDYQQFRLVGTRDYLAADERCIDVSPAGLELVVNEHKSDLLLESELRRFAERGDDQDDRLRYHLTVDSLRSARRFGLDEQGLDAWFRRRAGQALPPTARLLLTADEAPPFALARQLTLRVPTEELANGLAAWPETAELVGKRLAPTVFALPDDSADRLRATLERLGIRCDFAAN
jgi:hypothetical protein